MVTTDSGQYFPVLRSPDVLNPSRDPDTCAVFESARRLAPEWTPVLILGEPGSGRGLLARFIHQRGPVPDSPFVELDCGGLETLHFVENGSRGTVYLRDVEQLSPTLQEQLAGLLREKRLALRIVVGGSADLIARSAAGQFPQSLADVFASSCLRVPSLRQRSVDLPDLVERLIHRRGAALRIGEAVMGYLVEYDWPGNIGELEQVVERMCERSGGGVASADDLPPQIRWFPGRYASIASADEQFDPLREEFQLRLIAEALKRTHRRAR